MYTKTISITSIKVFRTITDVKLINNFANDRNIQF